MTNRLKLLVAAAVIAAAVAAVVAATRGGAAEPERAVAPRSTFSIAAARAFGEFPVYDVGATFDGLPRTAVLRRVGAGVNYVSAIYGDCTPASDEGCAPPLEIQSWPACLRNPGIYARQGPMGLNSVAATVRGVPGAYFEDGTRLEVQPGDATVVVFAPDKEAVDRAAAALRGVNLPVQARDRLPAPAAGVLDGTIRCAQ
jgi:hypothetical protein